MGVIAGCVLTGVFFLFLLFSSLGLNEHRGWQCTLSRGLKLIKPILNE